MKEELPSSTKEGLVLALLLAHEGQVVSSGTILMEFDNAARERRGFFRGAAPSGATTSMYIRMLREQGYDIQTVRGQGYRLLGKKSTR